MYDCWGVAFHLSFRVWHSEISLREGEWKRSIHMPMPPASRPLKVAFTQVYYGIIPWPSYPKDLEILTGDKDWIFFVVSSVPKPFKVDK